MIKLAMLSESIGIIGEWTEDKNVYSCKFPAWLRIKASTSFDKKGREFWSFAKHVSPFDGLGASDDRVEVAADKLLVFPFEVHDKDLADVYSDLIKKHVEHYSGLIVPPSALLGLELRRP